jgi:hypothetical protein
MNKTVKKLLYLNRIQTSPFISGTNDVYFLCNGPRSYAHHHSPLCPGFKDCSLGPKRSKTNEGRQACMICGGGPAKTN